MSVPIMSTAFASLAEAGVQAERAARRGTQRSAGALTLLADMIRPRHGFLASDFSVTWHPGKVKPGSKSAVVPPACTCQ